MTKPIVRMRRFVMAFCEDTSAIILPYAAMMLVVFIGLSALALDLGRQASLQTQMQAAADALALAGARELNQQAGAEGRATNAINGMVSNGLTGMGYTGTISHSVAFYSALPAAASGFAGTAATSDINAKYVSVTVAPVSLASTFAGTGLKAGAQAIAGFTSQTVCNIPPVFICNPYETAEMSDSAATAALRTNVALASTQRKQLRLDPTKSGPGQFGYLVPPDNCNGASCLETWIAVAQPKACYQTSSVGLNTGFKNSVTDAFNVRFDMYVGNLKNKSSNPNYAPAVNVRKGYQTTGQVCSPTKPNPYLTTLPGQTASLIPNTTIITATGNTDNSGQKTCKLNPTICSVTGVQANVISQVQTWLAELVTPPLQPTISGTNIPPGTLVTAASGSTLTINTPVTGKKNGVPLTIGWPTSGLPMDTSLVGNSNTFGNGQWDCDNYWKINHPGVNKPADLTAQGSCSTPGATTVSRYQVYRSEIDNGLHTAFSWPGSRAAGGESGTPLCAPAGVDVSSTQTDRRLIFVAVINCLANGPFGGGATANNVPVAGFGKFFMTQPVGADPDTPNAVIGEMSGLVGINDNVTILNQVQLYR